MNIVFDLGAVMVQWQPHDLLRLHFPNEAATPEMAHSLAKDFFHHADWMGFDRGTQAMEQVIVLTGARLGLPGTAVTALVENIGDYLTALPDSVAMLDGLRKLREGNEAIRLYYLSNMPQPYARTLEKRYEFFQWFDGGVFSGDVNHIKPEPAIYELLTARYGLQPERTVFIDDMAVNITAAQTHGWHGIQFQSAAQVQAELDVWMALKA